MSEPTEKNWALVYAEALNHGYSMGWNEGYECGVVDAACDAIAEAEA